ncbi:MAG: chemotaxis protein CheR, partial [Armatimonadetes bacterium]|nr:chemotaxis protein CheR [Armatimonadota bacterium]
MRLSHETVLQARALIADRFGLDFTEQRQADLKQRLIRALGAAADVAPEAYLSHLASLPAGSPDLMRFASYLVVGETYFFRDGPCFEALEQRVLPSLIADRRSAGIRRLRLWSAGCATGEEAYSLAILLDRLLPDWSDWSLTLLATDVNPEALDKARQGRYGEWSFRNTPQWVRDRYFQPRGAHTFQVVPRIRQAVTLAPLNLAEDCYPSAVTRTTGMDLILCRNVLMYFAREAQRATVRRLQRALVPGGWLVVSPSEATASLLQPLIPVNFPGVILFQKERHPRVAPMPLWQAETPLLTLPPVPMAPEEPQFGVVAPHTELQAAEPAADGHPELVSRDPVEAGDLLQRARDLADQGNLEQAQWLCETALARDRLDPEIHLLQAAICLEQGEVATARQALRRAIYLAPDFAPAYFLLGAVL